MSRPKNTPGRAARRMLRQLGRRPLNSTMPFHTSDVITIRQNATSSAGVPARLTNVDANENSEDRDRHRDRTQCSGAAELRVADQPTSSKAFVSIESASSTIGISGRSASLRSH